MTIFRHSLRLYGFGHHFAAIAGPGPLVGPTLAAQLGYLPGTLWLIIGAVLGGCVQDFVILFASMRRDGKSLGQIAKEEVGPVAGFTAGIGIMRGKMRLFRKLWDLLGQILGEGEYARYCEHMHSRHPGVRLPTAREFYVSRLNEKYARPNRCC